MDEEEKSQTNPLLRQASEVLLIYLYFDVNWCDQKDKAFERCLDGGQSVSQPSDKAGGSRNISQCTPLDLHVDSMGWVISGVNVGIYSIPSN